MTKVSLCCRWMLTLLGAALMLAALLPFAALLRVPEPYLTAWVSAKLLMLPVGAMCLWGAAALASKGRR